MAHNLATAANGKKMFASLRELPWHNHGTVFQEELTGAEMLKVAGLDYQVRTSEMYFDSVKADGTVLNRMKIEGRKAVYRDDTGQDLGVVGEDYEVFQNHEVVDFFEGLVNGSKIIYETAGGLGKGELVWILARIPDLKLDVKGDEILPYMLINNGHTGNSPLCCYPTTVRVVCANTLKAASKEFRENRKKKGRNNIHSGYRIKHRKNMRDIVAEVQKSYEACIDDFNKTNELFLALANRNFTNEERKKFFEFVASPSSAAEEDKADVSSRKQTMMENKVDILEKISEYQTNTTVATRGTFFGLLNTATEYIDHERATRCTDDKDESYCKFESSMYGTGDRLKTDVLEYLTALI
jgi:phage/plasmid-like protein (TIGR03299 family)